jgi:hypothetical protein
MAQQVESRLVSEFMLDRFPGGEWKLRVPLGPAVDNVLQMGDQGRLLRSSRPFRFEADAVCFADGKLTLIEGKLLRLREGLGDLVVYRHLVERTPELRPFAGRPVRLWLLTPWWGTWLGELAGELGVEVQVYAPDWVQGYVDGLHEYHTPAGRERREARKQALINAGLAG